MAELGSYYITIMPSMQGFTSQVNKELGGLGSTGGSKFSGSFMDVLKGSAIGTTLGNLASKAGNSIMDGLSTGINRLDTIKNFPRVMQSLGYSTKEADKSIHTIMKHLDGLPTSTQEMVTLTQAISDSTGDLDLATKAALGFNDMMLANGASAAEVATAQGVLNRVLGKGSATAAQWQSLTSVMPAQLGLVAKHMLGAGASTEDLHEALENGTVSWQDFLQAIADLDKSGYIDDAGRQIASFEEQARANSDGIGTAIDNIKNRIGAGWADILEAIGRSDISGAINTMSYAVRDGMGRIADGITYVKGLVENSTIGDSLSRIGDAIGHMADNLWSDSDTELVKQFAEGMVRLVEGALKWLADNGELVAGALFSIGSGIAALGLFTLITDLATFLGLMEGVPGIIGIVAAAVAANPFALLVVGIGMAVGAIWYFFTQTEEGKKLWEDFCNFMSDLWNGLHEDWDYLCTRCQEEAESFKAFIDGLPAWWDGVKKYWSDALNEQAENFKMAGDKIKKDFGEAFENLKNDAREKMEAAKRAVSEKLEALKNLFHFEWSLPAPKLPHINYHWRDIGGVLSIPVFDGISWYAKGGIFNAPTIAGLGEAGTEAALPLNKRTYGQIARGITAEMGGTGGVVIEKIADTLIVRNEDDIDYIINEVSRRTARERMALA